MAVFSDIMGLLKASGNLYAETNKDTTVIRLLKNVINRTEKVIDACDKFLKNHGVNIADLSNQARANSKSAFSKMKGMVGKVKQATPGKLGSLITDGAVGAAVGIRRFLKPTIDPPTPTDALTGTPATVAPVTDKLDQVVSGITQLVELTANKVKGKDKGDAPQENKWYERLFNRSKGRKDEVDAEKKAAKDRLNPKKDPSWLTKILKWGGLLIGGISTGFSLLKTYGMEGLKWLGGKLWAGTKWLGRQAWKGLKWLGGKTLKGLAWAGKWIGQQTWKGLKWLGGKLWEGTKWLGNWVAGKVSDLGKSIWNAGGRLVTGMKNAVVGGAKYLINGLGNIIKAGFSGLTSALGGMMSGISKAAGWVKDKAAAAKGAVVEGVEWVTDKASKAGKAVKGVIGNVSSATANLIEKSGIKKLGAGAVKVIGKQVFKRLATGAIMVLSGPVGWAVGIGMLLWDAYSLYKWITEDKAPDTPAGKLTELRFMSYGFSRAFKENFTKLIQLESALETLCTAENGKAVMRELDDATIQGAMAIFGIDPSETDKADKFQTWLFQRFVPAFKVHMNALYAVAPGTKTAELDKLTPSKLVKYASAFTPSASIFTIVDIPVADDTISTVIKDDFDSYLASIIKELKAGNRGDDKAPGSGFDKPTERNVKMVEIQQKTTKALNASVLPQPIKTVPNMVSNAAINELRAEQEGPDQGKSGGIPPLLRAPTAGKTAAGDMLEGDGSLVGITYSGDKRKLTNLDPDVFRLFTGMAKEYNAITGKNIAFNEGWRSQEDQAALYKKYGAGRAAKPGSSLHEYGLAIDINTADVRKLDEMGLLRKYGFSTAIGKETWHIEPIGITLDPQRARTDMAWRKQAIETSPGKGGGGYGLQPGILTYGRNIDYQRRIFNSPTTGVVTTDMMAGAPKPTFSPAPTSVATGSEVPQNPALGGGEASPGGFGTLESIYQKVAKPANQGNTLATATYKTPVASSNPFGSLTNTAQNDAEYAPSNSPIGTSVGSSGTPFSNAAMMGGSMSPVDAIMHASNVTGVDSDLLLTMGKMESSLKPTAKAGTSSATGLFQFTEDTWLELLANYGKQHNIPLDASRDNPTYNAILAAEYIKKNLSYVKDSDKAGIPKHIALYLAHFLGPTGAKDFIAGYIANPNTPMSQVVGAKQYAANSASMGNKTAAQFLQGVMGRFNTAANTSVSDYGQAPSTLTPKPSTGGLMTVSQVSTAPSVASPGYDPSYNSGSATSQAPIITQSGIETVMQSQLTAMNRMVELLTSIDGKVGSGSVSTPKPTYAENRAKATTSQSKVSGEPSMLSGDSPTLASVSKSYSKSAVDVSRAT